MRVESVFRFFCWVSCCLLAVLSVGAINSSFAGGIAIFVAAVLLCPDLWRIVNRVIGTSIDGIVFSALAFPLFMFGAYVSISSEIPDALSKDIAKASGYFQSLFEGDGEETDKSSGPDVDQGALSFFRNVMEQDYLIGLSGGKSALVELSMVSPVERLPSSRLAKIYEENETSADQFYRGKKIIVSGEIVGVRINFADDVIVELPGSNDFSNVQAELHQDVGRYTGPLMEGEYVGLYCSVRGRVLDDSASLIYLEDCESVDFSRDARDYASRLAETMSAWLHAGGEHAFPSDFAASYFLATYLTGTKLPAENPCRVGSTVLEACISSLEGFNTRSLFEMARDDLDRWRKWLALPPLASHVSSR
ncbi:TRNA-anti-like protein [compost metagenome]